MTHPGLLYRGRLATRGVSLCRDRSKARTSEFSLFEHKWQMETLQHTRLSKLHLVKGFATTTTATTTTTFILTIQGEEKNKRRRKKRNYRKQNNRRDIIMCTIFELVCNSQSSRAFELAAACLRVTKGTKETNNCYQWMLINGVLF